jgi:hypothetical protein
LFFKNLQGIFQQRHLPAKKNGVEWQDNLESLQICKISSKWHTNLQIRINFRYVKYYLGIPSLHVSLGLSFTTISFLLCPIDFYSLCSHVYRRLVDVSVGPLSTLDPKSCHRLCPLKKMFLHSQCALHNSIASMHFFI